MYDGVVFAFVAAVVVCVSVGGWLVARHDRSGPAVAMGAFMLVVGLWAGTHVGSLSATTEVWLLRFTQLSYVAVVLVPVVWLILAMRYRELDHLLSRRRIAALLVVPALTLGLVFTARSHTLFYTSIDLVTVAGRPMLQTTAGPWHAVNIVYSYSVLLVGTGLLCQAALTDNRLYRRQSVVLLACVSCPWLVNIAYHLGIRPIPWVDPTPLAFTLVGIPLAVVVVRTDLATFLPVAHERVFRTIDDPIVVASPDGTVIDANQAARTVLGDGERLHGRPADQILPAVLCREGGLDPSASSPVECSLAVDGEERTYVCRRREIEPGPEAPSRGVLVSLVDITVQKTQHRSLERKTARLREQTDRLERKNDQLERLADIASHDLRGPLATADRLVALLEADLDDPDPAVRSSLADLEAVHERLAAFADHLPQLARESTDVESTAACDIEAVARRAWGVVRTDGTSLVVADSRTVQADPRRLERLFQNLFRNAVEHGAGGTGAWEKRGTAGSSPAPGEDNGEPISDSTAPPMSGTPDGGIEGAAHTGADQRRRATAEEDQGDDSVTAVRVGTTERGFFVADDGIGIDPDRREDVFEYGTSTGDGSGFGLAIVRSIVEAHGWTVELTAGESGGARFDIDVEDASS